MLYVLYESASGLSLFEVLQVEEIGQSLDRVQQATTGACGTCVRA